jgi:hypothetical protein
VLGDFEAIETREPDIEQDEVRSLGVEGRECLRAGACFDHFEAKLLERGPRQEAGVVIVVDDENA